MCKDALFFILEKKSRPPATSGEYYQVLLIGIAIVLFVR